eukprot:4542042-Prymnesium_polylepis.1
MLRVVVSCRVWSSETVRCSPGLERSLLILLPPVAALIPTGHGHRGPRTDRARAQRTAAPPGAGGERSRAVHAYR